MEQLAVENVVRGAYIIAAILFILGLKRLASPATARTGNRLAASGMLIAVVVTLLDRQIMDFTWIIAGMVAGGAIGLVMARTVRMTAMPQMVAVFNGFGGGASALVASAELFRLAPAGLASEDVVVTVMVSTAIGALTFTGSMIAFGKLQGLVTPTPVLLPLRNPLNAVLGIGIIVVAGWLVVQPDNPAAFGAVVALALFLGILLVIPIGGADMPVVIALLS